LHANRLSPLIKGRYPAGGRDANDRRTSGYLEGQVSEHVHTLLDLRDSIRQFERRVEARFDAVDRRFEIQDEKLARQFTWVVGIQVTTLVAILGALPARS
jgi:hypothetical protein